MRVFSLLFSPKFDSLWKFRFISVDIIKNLYTKRDKGDGVTKCPLLYIFRALLKLIVAFSFSGLVHKYKYKYIIDILIAILG